MRRLPDLRDLPAVGHLREWPWTEASAPPPSAAVWPRFTIVIPSFNQGRFIEETIRSVLLQAYPDLELIVIDGGSTDSTVAVLRRYEPWLKFWTSAPDRGQSDAINKGFARATGEIITFLSSDDVYEPGTLQDVAQQWRDHPDAGAIVGGFRFMDQSSRRYPDIHPPRLPGPGPHDLALLDTALWRLHQVATFYTSQALDEVGRSVRENLDYTMDRELLYRVCRRFPAALSQRAYAAFRRHPQGKSTAMILPMSREMADLHLLDAPHDEDRAVRRRRRALWHERRARGWLKLARSGVRGWVAVGALLSSLRYRPSHLLKRHYYVSWLSICGLLPSARRIYRALRRESRAHDLSAEVRE